MLCGYYSKNLVLFLILSFFLLGNAFAKDEKEENTKPSIKEMTSQKASEAVAAQVPNMDSLDAINTHSVGLGLGQTALDGDFSNHGADSITPSFFYEYSASHTFNLLVELHRTTHKLKNEKVILAGLPIWVKAKVLQYDAFTPFVMAGLGFYLPSETRIINDQALDSKTNTTLGLNLGLGSDLRLNRHFSVGLLGAYYDPFDVKQDTAPPVSGRYYKLLITGFYHF